MQRMTAQSARNIQAADTIEITQMPSVPDRWVIALSVGNRRGYVASGDGLIMLYNSVDAARRAVRRHTDVVPAVR